MKLLKTSTRKVIAFFALALAITGGLNSCNTDNIVPYLNINSTDLGSSLIVYTSSSPQGTPLPDKFKVTVSGPESQYVRTAGGNTDFTVLNGMLTLTIPSGSPAPANGSSYDVKVTADVPGFAKNETFISIYSVAGYGIYAFSAKEYAVLQASSNPPASTATTTVSTPLNAGTSSGTTVTVPANSTVNNGVTVTVPAGTQVQDNNCKAITAATSLTTTVQHYGPGSNGVNTNFSIDAATRLISTGDLVNVSMTAGTTTVGCFSKPVLLAVELTPGALNSTCVPLKAGDNIPAWSQDSNTGLWKAEGSAYVTQANGKLTATTAITHTGLFTCGYAAGYNNRTVNFNFKPSNAPWLGSYQYRLVHPQADGTDMPLSKLTSYSPHTNHFLLDDGVHAPSLLDSTTYGVRFPKILQYCGTVSIVLYQAGSTTPFARSAPVDLNTVNSVDVNITTPQLDVIRSVLDADARCSDKKIALIPSLWFKITNVTTGDLDWVYSNTNDGVETSLVISHHYIISTVYDGTAYATDDFVARREDFRLTASGLNGFSGINIYGVYYYNGGRNSLLRIYGDITVNCK